MKLSSLQDLYVDELKDLYNAENQILGALPKMAQAASSNELRMAFQEHEHQTRAQVERLDKIFDKLDMDPKGKPCRGIQGIIAEGDEFIQGKPDPAVMDAGLISMAQRVEHYEIAGYGSVRTYAQQLGLNEDANLLQQTLDEEGETDKKLTRLAEQRGINQKAEQR